ncbi:DUF6291 domain-containing protein [Alistipes putredinis]|uniref:DUF6291 domain-containing protein n=1 Tax=Alistipes putredinis TaxID=28117 RepID=UPI003AB57823
MKESMVIPRSLMTATNRLSMAEKGEVLDAIMRYGFNSDEYTGDSVIVAMIFDLMKPYIDENNNRYNAVVERNRVNGKKGGRPKKEENPEKPRETQQNPVGYFGNPEKPSRTQTNLDTDTDTDTDTVPTVSNTSRTDVLEDAEIVDIETEISGKNSKRVRAREKPETPKEVTWRDSFEVYLQDCRDAWKRWVGNREWMAERQRFNPGVNIKLTLEKACKEFWATEAGWLHKKKGRGKTIDWKRIFEYAISQKTNRVYERSKDNSRGKDGLTDDERDQLDRALQSAVNASRMHEIVP